MGGKLSGPHDKLAFSLFIADITSASVKITVSSVRLSRVRCQAGISHHQSCLPIQDSFEMFSQW